MKGYRIEVVGEGRGVLDLAHRGLCGGTDRLALVERHVGLGQCDDEPIRLFRQLEGNVEAASHSAGIDDHDDGVGALICGAIDEIGGCFAEFPRTTADLNGGSRPVVGLDLRAG